MREGLENRLGVESERRVGKIVRWWWKYYECD
jgi:hypothetical protein